MREYQAPQDATEVQLIEAFSFIESIPDDILSENDSQALEEWYVSLRQDRINWFACGLAVGWAIVSNFTPAKIVKIKSAIKTVGGAVTFAKKAYSVYKRLRAGGATSGAALRSAIGEAARAAGPDAREALLDLFEIGTVIEACGFGG